MYRPQFPFPPPPDGCHYESFVYAFDESNTPALAGLNLAAGETVLHIPLLLDEDADFIWFGVKVDPSALGIRIETPWTDPLQDDFTPATLWADPASITPLDAPVECPAGAILSLSLKNLG